MKMNNIRKISLSLALVMIIASLFSISVFADNTPFAVWSVSDDKTELTNESEGIKYHRYNTGISVDAEPSITYVYANGVNYDDSYYGYESAICQNPEYKDAVWIEGYYGDDIFVNNAASVVTISGGEVSGQFQISAAATVTVSGAPKLLNLKLGSTVKLTLGQLTTGAQLSIAAAGAFTNESAQAKAYLDAGYFTCATAGKTIREENGVLIID